MLNYNLTVCISFPLSNKLTFSPYAQRIFTCFIYNYVYVFQRFILSLSPNEFTDIYSSGIKSIWFCFFFQYFRNNINITVTCRNCFPFYNNTIHIYLITVSCDVQFLSIYTFKFLAISQICLSITSLGDMTLYGHRVKNCSRTCSR